MCAESLDLHCSNCRELLIKDISCMKLQKRTSGILFHNPKRDLVNDKTLNFVPCKLKGKSWAKFEVFCSRCGQKIAMRGCTSHGDRRKCKIESTMFHLDSCLFASKFKHFFGVDEKKLSSKEFPTFPITGENVLERILEGGIEVDPELNVLVDKTHECAKEKSEKKTDEKEVPKPNMEKIIQSIVAQQLQSMVNSGRLSTSGSSIVAKMEEDAIGNCSDIDLNSVAMSYGSFISEFGRDKEKQKPTTNRKRQQKRKNNNRKKPIITTASTNNNNQKPKTKELPKEDEKPEKFQKKKQILNNRGNRGPDPRIPIQTKNSKHGSVNSQESSTKVTGGRSTSNYKNSRESGE
eukprot:TRINITY_DN34493_c0_g1_i3.p1 TRINITY_DN34493_c0_g1~~TRINITY_DN34493_c0_g1_i3.p1  ORF type:complete len:349 (+),score=84.95 TRINITY_DN34493_c0_g1_i3:106-1152(+)